MDIGAKFLHALCVEQDPYSLLKAKVSPEYFAGAELQVYEFVSHHLLTNGKLPQPSTLLEEFPEVPETVEPSQYYLTKVEQRFKHRTLNKGLMECSDLMKDKQYDAAVQRMQEVTGLIYEIEHRQQIADLGEEGWDIVKEAYNKAKVPGSTIRFGWEYLDSMTMGLSAGDVVATIGRPGLGKTFLLLYTGHHAWNVQHKNVLFLSMEMSMVPVVQRIAAIHTGINIGDLKAGMLPIKPVNLEKKLAAKMIAAKKHPGKFWIVDGNMTSTPEQLFGLASQLKPDLVLIDGAYLLKHENPRVDRYIRVAENIEAIKKFTSQLKVPTHCTYQFNRQATKKKKKTETPGLEDIAYSDAIGQICSVVLGLFQEESVETIKSRTVTVLKGREGETGKFSVKWDFQRMDFSQVTYEDLVAATKAPLDYL